MERNINEYKKELLNREYEKYLGLSDQLPRVITSYINVKAVNWEDSTTTAYAEDLLMFLQYLISHNPSLAGKEPKDISEEVLNMLTYEDINEYLIYLKKACDNSQKTMARRLSAIRGFFKYAAAHNILRSDPTAGAESIRIKTEKHINTLSNDEVSKVSHAIEYTELSGRKALFSEKTKFRDMAIFTLLSHVGLRVSECAGLNLSSIDFEERCLYVVRKGNLQDRVYFDNDVYHALKDYIELERPAFTPKNGWDDTPLFFSIRKKRMEIRSIQHMLKKYTDASIPMHDKVSPHVLRKTYGTALYMKTGDPKLVQSVLGHKNISTTVNSYIGNDRKWEAKDIDVYGND